MSDAQGVSTVIAAVRGAVSVARNDPEEIRSATARLLRALLEANGLTRSQIVCALFTATADLDADFPAHAARKLGWDDVPLLCAQEIDVPGSLPRVVRVLLTVSCATARKLVPIYLDGAAALRPDLIRGPLAGAPRGRVALIGLGQIGGSIGLALGRAGSWHRVGFDIDSDVRQRALAVGAIDENAGSVREACLGADLAVIATPVDTLAELIGVTATALPRGAALIDTGSARAGITAALEHARARGIEAVGGHPLAGGAGRGLTAARADLFESAPFAILWESEGLPGVIRGMLDDLGARPVRVGPDDHDRSLARTSHLPYLLACALASLGQEPARRDLYGPGWRDMTRLSASDERIALSYCRANAGEVAAAWREFRLDMDSRLEALREGVV